MDAGRKEFFLAPSLVTKAGKKRPVEINWCGRSASVYLHGPCKVVVI